MPNNLKEELIFTGLMAGMMVFGMTFYNVTLQNGLNGHAVLTTVTGFPFALIVAALIDLLIIGPFAKQLFFSTVKRFNFEPKGIHIGLGISILMVLGMVTCMSLFGLIMGKGIASVSMSNYWHAWQLNVIVALPLQLIVVGPFARAILSRIQTN
ncbi:DUF2798 domain-containing protein [Weissella diestrammenae]|uniref:DUF2798 domain-containing protein n=1 Tax=Weissella diestrammenae TaxID=1162633 RepID=A0A7G9T5B6_9LACO|nr:DUF2798 domain-containing protein [Weissella diestrammenae]MCM0583149.1 DUF2798 domain-containing protein [Weissella diestrammenae]QNN75291.1 DUF2798 domain-containing protein [Weissella diestrammenae]